MSQPIRRNLVNFLVLVLASIAVVPNLVRTAQWAMLNYVTAVALAVGVVWFVVDLARSAVGSSR